MVSTLCKCSPANSYFPRVYSIKITCRPSLFFKFTVTEFRGGEVLQISSDRDRRIFGGLKFSISGFFLVGTFWQAIFLIA